MRDQSAVMSGSVAAAVLMTAISGAIRGLTVAELWAIRVISVAGAGAARASVNHPRSWTGRVVDLGQASVPHLQQERRLRPVDRFDRGQRDACPLSDGAE
jgi:hypothetical protein